MHSKKNNIRKVLKIIAYILIILFLFFILIMYFWDKSVERRVTKLVQIDYAQAETGFEWYDTDYVSFLLPEDSIYSIGTSEAYTVTSAITNTKLDFSLIPTKIYDYKKNKSTHFFDFLTHLINESTIGDTFLLADATFTHTNNENTVVINYEISKTFGETTKYTLRYTFYINEEVSGEFLITSDNRYVLAIFLRSIALNN